MSADDPEAYGHDIPEEIEAPAPAFYTVALVLHDRAYGGPEEGGWYYEVYELTNYAHPELPDFLPMAFRTIEEAREGQKRMTVAIVAQGLNENRREISSVLSEGRYEARVFDGYPRNEPQQRPHYE